MSTFDPTKPFKTRAGNTVEIITVKGRGERALIGHLGSEDEIRIWYINGRYFQHRESEYDLVNVEPWKLPSPPEGMQWHRDDWTEDMLPGIKRPLLIGETGTYEILLSRAWEEGTSLDIPTPHGCPFMRTDRPLPSPPKMVPLTFEYVSKFVGVEFRLNESCVYGWRTISINGVDFPCVGLRSWSELMAYEWRSFQSPEWQLCEMEGKV